MRTPKSVTTHKAHSKCVSSGGSYNACLDRDVAAGVRERTKLKSEEMVSALPLCPPSHRGLGVSQNPTVLSVRPVFTHWGHGTTAASMCGWMYLKCHYPLLSSHEAITSGN